MEGTERVMTYPCPLCNVSFMSAKMRKQHKKKIHPKCEYCKRNFPQKEQLESHQRQANHGYCKDCDLCFSKSSLLHHVRTVEHAETFQCCDCGRGYFDQKSLNNHCCDCDRAFKCPQGLQDHLRASRAHKPLVGVPRVDVQRTEGSQQFHNPAQEDRQGSRKTSVKKGRGKKKKKSRLIPCLVGEDCKKRFHSPSGLLHHLESGSCRSGMTRQTLKSLIIAHDQSHYITTEDADSSDTSEQNSLCRTPSSTLSARSTSPSLDEWDLLVSPELEPLNSSTNGVRLHSIADENSDSNEEWTIIHSAPQSPSVSDWFLVGNNSEVASSLDILGEDLRCTLCPSAGPRFRSIRALLAHKASAVHDSKLFHCPVAFGPEVKSAKSHGERRFSSLGGLAQHVESGACRGHETFRLVFKYVEEQLSLLGILGVKLLIE